MKLLLFVSFLHLITNNSIISRQLFCDENVESNLLLSRSQKIEPCSISCDRAIIWKALSCDRSNVSHNSSCPDIFFFLDIIFKGKEEMFLYNTATIGVERFFRNVLIQLVILFVLMMVSIFDTFELHSKLRKRRHSRTNKIR